MRLFLKSGISCSNYTLSVVRDPGPIIATPTIGRNKRALGPDRTCLKTCC